MSEERLEAYQNLIEELLNSSSYEAALQILNANSDLVDVGFEQTMLRVANNLIAWGDLDKANFLMNLAGKLIGVYGNTSDVQLNFLKQVLLATSDSKANPQVVYSLLQENLNLLDDNMAQVLRSWATATLAEAGLDEARAIAAVIGSFSYLIDYFPLGNRASNVEIAISGYQVVATVFTREAFPVDWATTQNYLGNAYDSRIKGERAENLESAITAYEQALEVRPREAFPVDWATTQINLGNVYLKRIRGEQEKNLEVAIHYLLAALEVFSYEAFPQQWATVQYNLGIAYLKRIEGERAENLEVAIRSFLAAIQVCSREAFPEKWADIQSNLGVAYHQRIQGEQAKNLEEAIQCYLAALEVFSRAAFPKKWADIQSNLGNVYRDRIQGEKVENLEAAIHCFSDALQVFTHEAFPEEWAVTQNNLDNTRQELIQAQATECQITFLLEILQATQDSKGDPQVVYPLLQANLHLLDDNLAQVLRSWTTVTLPDVEPKQAQDIAAVLLNFSKLIYQFPGGSRASNLEIALTSNELAATIFKRESFPERWARIQFNLGHCYRNRVRGERGQNQENAIAAYKAGLQVFTREAFPDLWASTQHDLGNAYCDRIRGERAENLECALAAYQSALQVFTYESFPKEWAQIQHNLAKTYYERIRGNRFQNLEQTIAAYEAALKVYTQEAFPEMWEKTRRNLEIAYREQILSGQRQNLERLIELSAIEWPFLRQVWLSTSESGGDPQVIYPLLQSNLEKLNDDLAHQLRSYATFELSQMETSQVESGAKALGNFSRLISRFPLGNRASNLEIAIAGYEVILIIFTRDAFPQAWAITQMNLGDVYRERVRGDRVENQESAIAAYESALQVLTYEAFPKDWAQIQARLGIAYKDRKLGNPSKNLETAIAAYESALQVLTRKAFPRQWAEIQDDLANAYQKRIDGDRGENLEKAIAARQFALQAFTKEEFPKDWAMVQGNLGADYRIRIRGNRAENLEKAIAAYQSALQVLTRDSFPYEWALAQNNLGNAYGDRIVGERLENLKQAIAAQEAALTVWTHEVFPEGWIQCQNNLCQNFLYLLAGVYAKSDGSQDYSQAVYPLFQAHLDKLDGEILTEWWQSLIEFMLSEAEPEEAQIIAVEVANLSGLFLDIPLGQKATNLEIALIGYERIITVLTREASPEQWAQTKHNLGFIYTYRIRGDRAENLELAIRCLEEALKFYTPETFPEKWAHTQDSLGIAYFYRIRGERVENLELAIHCFKESLTIYTREAFLESWRNVKNHLGMAYSERIRGEKSQNIEKAIAVYKDTLTELTAKEFPTFGAVIHNNLAIAYGQRIQGNQAENLETALHYFEETLKIYTPEADPEGWASLQRNLGIVYKRQGQIDKAIESFRSALKIYTPTTFPIDCLNVGRNFGNTAFEAGRWAEAIEGYQAAVEAVEQSRFWSVSEERRQEILQEAIGVYTRIVQTFINNGQQYKAIEYVERSKARNLVELLTTRNLYPKGEFPEEVLNELDRLRREIAAEQRRIDSSSSLNVLRQQLNDLISQQIQPIDPAFSLTQKVESLEFHEIRKLLPDDKTSLIEWYVTPEYLYTFLITPERSQPTILPLPSENHQALINCVKSYISSYSQQKDKWQAELSGKLQQLAIILQLDQLISLIPDTCKQLILIPHRFLHLLPLHALPLNDGTCLLDHYQNGVSYAPSCQLLQLVQNQKRPYFQNLFAIQNPTGDLNYTDLEVETISLFFPKKDIKILAGQGATKTALDTYQNLPSIHCGHFSCHGYFNMPSPLKSALLLADCYIPTPETLDPNYHLPLKDGRMVDLAKCLTLGDIFHFNLNQCRLVILSACETGLIDFSSTSDEYIGLPSGFLYAGSSSVVSSLWTVDDMPTAYLMIKFLQNLKAAFDGGEDVSVAVALNQAQDWLRNITWEDLEKWANNLQLDSSNNRQIERSMRQMREIVAKNARSKNIDEKPFRSPYHWAGFTAIGK